MVAMLSLISAITTTSIAQEKEANKDKPDTEEVEVDVDDAVTELKKDMRSKVSELTKEYRKATKQSERNKITNRRRKFELQTAKKLIEVIKERDSVEDNARDLAYFFGQSKGKAQALLFEQIDQMDDAEATNQLLRGIQRLRSGSSQVEKWIRQIKKDPDNEDVAGFSTLVLAEYLNKFERPGKTGKALEKLQDEIESLLTTCVDEYEDHLYVGSKAEQMLTAMNVRVGKIAPDIVGVDTDDVEFKLSDYRGKVVLIDFWGDW